VVVGAEYLRDIEKYEKEDEHTGLPRMIRNDLMVLVRNTGIELPFNDIFPSHSKDIRSRALYW